MQLPKISMRTFPGLGKRYVAFWKEQDPTNPRKPFERVAISELILDAKDGPRILEKFTRDLNRKYMGTRGVPIL